MYLIGDVHGKTTEYQALLDSLPEGSRSVQLGDMGLGFKGVNLRESDLRHKFLRGNHDSPDDCQLHPNYLGDFGTFDWEGKRVFWVSGAFSIDWKWRTPGVSWWFNEEIGHDKIGELLKLYKEVKPNIVLSHECPGMATKVMLGVPGVALSDYHQAKMECVLSRTCQMMDAMMEIHAPEDWYFGHYHIDKVFYVGPTRFHCLAELSCKRVEIAN